MVPAPRLRKRKTSPDKLTAAHITAPPPLAKRKTRAELTDVERYELHAIQNPLSRNGQKERQRIAQRSNMARYLKVFEETGDRVIACRACNWPLGLAKRLAAEDAAFAAALKLAEDAFLDRCEAEVYRRAVVGVARDVYYQGGVCGQETVYSDGLLMFLLKGRRPGVYKERITTEHTGPEGGPVQFIMPPLLASSELSTPAVPTRVEEEGYDGED